MTGEELGTLLGDAITELEGVALAVEECAGQLHIGDVSITKDEADAENAGEGLSMTACEFNEFLADAASELDSLIADIEGVKSVLLSIDANDLFVSE